MSGYYIPGSFQAFRDTAVNILDTADSAEVGGRADNKQQQKENT